MTNPNGMSLAQLSNGSFNNLPGGAGIGQGLVSRGMFGGMNQQQASQAQQQLQSQVNNGSTMWGPGAAAQMSKLGQIASGFQGGDQHHMGPLAQMANQYGGAGTQAFQQALMRSPQLQAQYDILSKPGNSQYAQVAQQYGGMGRFGGGMDSPMPGQGAPLGPTSAASAGFDPMTQWNQYYQSLVNQGGGPFNQPGSVPVGNAAQGGGVMNQPGFNPNPFGPGTGQGIMGGNIAAPSYRTDSSPWLGLQSTMGSGGSGGPYDGIMNAMSGGQMSPDAAQYQAQQGYRGNTGQSPMDPSYLQALLSRSGGQ